MKASLLLCEAAQTVDGKLFILGGGISDLHSPVASLALAGQLVFEGSEVNREHSWSLGLFDADGQPVLLTGEGAQLQPVAVDGQAAVRVEGSVPLDASFPCAIAVTFVNLNLAAGAYFWGVEISGVRDDSWRVPFTVHDHRQVPGQPLWNDPLMPR